MKKVGMLDCTLRDGGYVNNWNFGHCVIAGTYKRLEAAGVEFIETGFLDERTEFDINRSIVPDTRGFNEIFRGIRKHGSIPVAMIDYGTCGLKNIQNCDDTFLDGIRVIFKKDKIDEALLFCREIKEKGYKLFIQAVSITSYSDREILDYVQKINEVEPYAFSIVDTYGLLDERKLKNYFYIIDNNLSAGIRIGYHAHNNFQLAFSNTIRFLAMETQREIIADATVYGMGKSAGNCPGELIAMHMNEKYGKSYDLNQLLEILDTDLMPVYKEHYWGYKYNFYISAMQNVHPDYVRFLLEKKTLTVSSVNAILADIPKKKKLTYDEPYIKNAYIAYQSGSIDDREAILSLKQVLSGRDILMIGPGKSIIHSKERIDRHIQDNKSIVISLNFIPSQFACDYIFVSNAKRYSKLMDAFQQTKTSKKLIITSNVTPYDSAPVYLLNIDSLMSVTKEKEVNALTLCLEMLVRVGVPSVSLAGFDGFTMGENYYDGAFSFAGNEQYRVSSNRQISSAVRALSEYIEVTFITESLYQEM